MVVYRMLADLLVLLHGSFVGFVVAGLPLVFAGRLRRWEWTRNFWFRLAHAAAILFVVLLTWLDVPCPLTLWENSLRERAGQARYPGDFIGYWMHELLFFDFPPLAFAVTYTLFGVAVVVAFCIAPPRWPTRSCDARHPDSVSRPL